MRLFTAIDLCDDLRQAVAREQQRLRDRLGDRDVAWVRPANMHLTLVFIGNADEPLTARVVDAMSNDFAIAPFELRVGTIGRFPERGAPRVLWLGIGQGAEPVEAVHEAVAARLQMCGVPRELRRFHPHLTLGRWRRGGRASARVSGGSAGCVIDTWRTAALDVPMVVDRVTTFSSRLSPSGPAYTAVAHARLT